MTAQAESQAEHRFVLHIASRDSWRARESSSGKGSGEYRDPSLDTEGFIHCSTVDQVLIPANERFSGRNDLVLLVIDTDRLDRKPVYEDCYASGTRFPHVYGPIPISAVVGVVDFPPDANGRFSEPVELRPLLVAETVADRRADRQQARCDQRRRIG